MRVSAALFLVPLIALAQPSAPRKVDEALRARVNEFFQDHVEGNFRKAYELVAEDTKDYYFATQKVRFKSFKIESIAYSDHFTHAEVTLNAERVVQLPYPFLETVMPSQMKTTWKVENGKWVWYDVSRPTWITPMGPSDPEKLKNRGNSPSMPDVSQGAMQARASEIMKAQAALDKSEVVLPLDKPSSEQVVFHNGEPGSVKVYLDSSTKPPGVTAEMDKMELNAGENAVIKIHFDPKEGQASPAPFTLRVLMEPFGRAFPIQVRFAPHEPAPR